MTNEEILRKAIEKAVENGWEEVELNDGDLMCRDVYFEWILFDPEWAKAFWGEELGSNRWEQDYVWQYHQHRLLDEIQAGRDPIKYLEQFIS